MLKAEWNHWKLLSRDDKDQCWQSRERFGASRREEKRETDRAVAVWAGIIWECELRVR